MTDSPPLTKRHLKLIDTAAEIWEEPARVGDKAFAPRLLAITTFPHRTAEGEPGSMDAPQLADAARKKEASNLWLTARAESVSSPFTIPKPDGAEVKKYVSNPDR